MEKKIVEVVSVLGKNYTLDATPEGMDGFLVESIDYLMLGNMGVNRMEDKGSYKITLVNQLNDKDKLFKLLSVRHAVEVAYIEIEANDDEPYETSKVLKKAE
jgi:hypothetical protein